MERTKKMATATHRNPEVVTSELLLDDVSLHLNVKANLFDLICRLSRDLGVPIDDVIARGAVLLDIARDIDAQGKRLVVADDDLNVEREIIGILPVHGG